MIIFPRPFAIAIDDLGWMLGYNEGTDGYGPYRVGINREMTLQDYEAVKTLAKNVGVRLQGLFILGEMDRENFLGDFPTTTYMRENWDNTSNISDMQLEIMDYVKKESAYIEFGLHGVGHEYWPEDVKRRRAEWYNTEDDHSWPESEIRTHLDCFVRIMEQYGISKENGHSFPESFVPCAYSYYWNPEGEYSLGKVLGDYGVRFANTDFTQILECNPPLAQGGGFDHGVHVMNRYNYDNLWSALGKLPEVPLQDQTTDYIETHWPNLLAKENGSQDEITSQWTAYYQSVQQSEERYCAKNTHQMHSQWIYQRYVTITEIIEGVVSIDSRKMPVDLLRGDFPGNLVLKVALLEGQHIQKAELNGSTLPAYYEDQGFGFLYLPRLMGKEYTLRYELGPEILSDIIWHDGTSNIFDIVLKENEVKIQLCLYGKQVIKFRKDKIPVKVTSNNPGIEVQDWNITEGQLAIEMSAHDIQGELGMIEICY